MKGVLPWLVRWAYCANTRDFCPAMAAKSAQLKKIFPYHTLFQFICPHRTATWQAVVLGRLSLSMYLCLA
jgi:hypothetical protein